MSIMLVAQLLFALLESARSIELYRVLQMNTDSVLESLFADYASPLWEDYRMLGMTAADSSGQFSLNNREAMFRALSMANLESTSGFWDQKRSSLLTAEIVDVEFDEYMLITDQQGKVYQAAVTSYMKNNIVYETAKSVYSSYETVRDAQEQYGGGSTSIDDALNVLDSLQENESMERSEIKKASGSPSSSELDPGKNETEKADHLLTAVADVRKTGVISLVLPEKDSVSRSQIELDQAVSRRKLQQGTSQKQIDGSWYDQVLFEQYLVHDLSCYTDNVSDRGLNYELEYLIGGKSGDAANLKLVITELLAMREASNLASLANSPKKQRQAWEMAALLAGATVNPAVVEAVKLGILAAWAYAESVLDVRTLLQGGKIAIMKSETDWTSNPDAIPTLLSGWSQAKSSETGISYKDYLGLLLFFHSGSKLAMRAMDVQEAAIRKKAGYEMFRMDCLICEASVQTVYEYVPVFFSFVTLLGPETGRIRIPGNSRYSYLLGKAGAKVCLFAEDHTILIDSINLSQSSQVNG